MKVKGLWKEDQGLQKGIKDPLMKSEDQRPLDIRDDPRGGGTFLPSSGRK